MNADLKEGELETLRELREIKSRLIKAQRTLDDMFGAIHEIEEKIIGAAEMLTLFNLRD